MLIGDGEKNPQMAKTTERVIRSAHAKGAQNLRVTMTEVGVSAILMSTATNVYYPNEP